MGEIQFLSKYYRTPQIATKTCTAFACSHQPSPISIWNQHSLQFTKFHILILKCRTVSMTSPDMIMRIYLYIYCVRYPNKLVPKITLRLISALLSCLELLPPRNIEICLHYEQNVIMWVGKKITSNKLSIVYFFNFGKIIRHRVAVHLTFVVLH